MIREPWNFRRDSSGLLAFLPGVLALWAWTVVPASAELPRVLGGVAMGADLLAAKLDVGDSFGESVAVVGDLDGNGSADLAVGAPGDDDGGSDRGAVHFLFLDPDANVIAVAKAGALNVALEGALSDGDRFGASLAAIGDVDGDGVPDLAVGAVGDDDGALDAGAVWLLRLTSAGSVASAQKLSRSTPGLGGVASKYDGFGVAIASLDDADGKGDIELAIGAAGSDRVLFNAGAVWTCMLDKDGVVKSVHRVGESEGVDLDADLAERGAFGRTLTCHREELLVSAPGDSSGFEPEPLLRGLDLDATGKVEGWRRVLPAELVPVAPALAMASFGDFDFDGVRDLIVGRGFGLRLLLFAADGSVREARDYNYGNKGFGLPHGAYDGSDSLGRSLAMLGDVDGNLIPEVVAGRPGTNEVWLYRFNGESAPGAACGDPDGDGTITASDALFILRTAVGLRFCESLWCDVDASGRTTATDALAALGRAVDLEHALVCPTTTTTTTTSSSTSIAVDECFDDQDCVDYGWDEKLCCGYHCCECDNDDSDCAPGFVCEAEVCVPAP